MNSMENRQCFVILAIFVQLFDRSVRIKKFLLLLFHISLTINLLCQYSVRNNMDKIKDHRDLELTIAFQVNTVFNNFNDFSNVFDNDNIGLMNSTSGISNLISGIIYKNFYFGWNYGYSYDSNNKHDSIHFEFSLNQFGLNFGYNLINNKRFIIRPKAEIKWNRYRLLNNNKNRIPLEQYINDKELDIRFNQFVGFV